MSLGGIQAMLRRQNKTEMRKNNKINPARQNFLHFIHKMEKFENQI